MDLEMAATDSEPADWMRRETMLMFRLRKGLLERLRRFEVFDFVVCDRPGQDIDIGSKHWMPAGSHGGSNRGAGFIRSGGEFVRVAADTVGFNLASGTCGPAEMNAPIAIRKFRQCGMNDVFKGTLTRLPQRGT